MTFGWAAPMIRSVLEQARNGAPEISIPYLPARNRTYSTYHTWKRSCTASLSRQLASTPKEDALGRSPQIVNAVLWRIVQANRSTFLVTWFFDILLACARNLPAWSVKRFLQELEGAEARGTSRYAWAWLVIMTSSLAIRTLLTAADYFRWNGRLQTRIRSQVAAMVFEKTLLVSPLPPSRPSDRQGLNNYVTSKQSRQGVKVGKADSDEAQHGPNAFNLLTTDADRAALYVGSMALRSLGS